MKTGRAGDSKGQLFCWEQINRNNRLFRVSHVFAPRHCATQLVPLYALFAVIEQICSSISDDNVALSKLSWWRNELEPGNQISSQHPLMKELIHTGAAGKLPAEPLAQLFNGAANRITAAAPVDLAALESLCLDVYRPQLELELALSGPADGVAAITPRLPVRNGLLQLIRESTRKKEQSGYWWLPLNLLARHGVVRSDILNQPGSSKVMALLEEIMGEALCRDRKPEIEFEAPARDFAPARHIFAFSGLSERKLRRLATFPADQFGSELSRLRPGDLMCAWNSARRLG